MTGEQISVASGILISLVFSYVPGIREWYEAQDSTRKRLVMLLAMLIVAVVATALSCAKVFAYVDCSQAGITALLTNFVIALVTNQTAYLASPKRVAKV